MKKTAILLLAICLLLSGCDFWSNGSYHSVTPHIDYYNKTPNTTVVIQEYDQLQSNVEAMIKQGAESNVFSLQQVAAGLRQGELDAMIKKICSNYPLAIYGVKDIRYEFGVTGGTRAVSIDITYWQNCAKGEQIKQVENEEQLQEYFRSCLNTCEPRLVVYLDASLTVNYQQMVRNYAAEYPQYVMEIPKVTAKFYPEQGEKQVVELTFAYQTNPEELRMLQGKVARVFYSAFQHSSGEATDQKKAEKLYDFLMNRYEYVYQTTITPSYSLLLQGTGDSRTMAEIYSAMCRQVNVSCRTVTGKRNGITWTWNVVEIDGESYHLDLIYCKDKEEFILRTSEEMTEYTW